MNEIDCRAYKYSQNSNILVILNFTLAGKTSLFGVEGNEYFFICESIKFELLQRPGKGRFAGVKKETEYCSGYLAR